MERRKKEKHSTLFLSMRMSCFKARASFFYLGQLILSLCKIFQVHCKPIKDYEKAESYMVKYEGTSFKRSSFPVRDTGLEIVTTLCGLLSVRLGYFCPDEWDGHPRKFVRGRRWERGINSLLFCAYHPLEKSLRLFLSLSLLCSGDFTACGSKEGSQDSQSSLQSRFDKTYAAWFFNVCVLQFSANLLNVNSCLSFSYL